MLPICTSYNCDWFFFCKSENTNSWFQIRWAILKIPTRIIILSNVLLYLQGNSYKQLFLIKFEQIPLCVHFYDFNSKAVAFHIASDAVILTVVAQRTTTAYIWLIFLVFGIRILVKFFRSHSGFESMRSNSIWTAIKKMFTNLITYQGQMGNIHEQFLLITQISSLQAMTRFFYFQRLFPRSPKDNDEPFYW